MVYSSLLFIYGFLPVSLAVYYGIAEKYKRTSLVVLSVIFCGAMGLRVLALALVYLAVNYFAGRIMGHFRKKPPAAAAFVTASAFDLAALFMMRSQILSGLKLRLGFGRETVFLGFSLMTLSALGYLIDVWCSRTRAEKNLVSFGLYLLMFPRLIMGPIVRYETFRKIMRSRKADTETLGIGITIFVKGLAKKVIAGDSLYCLYQAVAQVDPSKLPVVSAWLGALAYIMCLYFTLSGLSDMGTGLCYCFGFRFPQGFNYPLFTGSLQYFAARWHTQVVHWFRKFVTRPLSSLTSHKWLRSITFIFSWTLLGCWYRFDICGAMWGLLMGAAIVIEKRFRDERLMKATGIIYTTILTTLFAVFLLAESPGNALQWLFAMIGGNRIFADSHTIYLVREFAVMIIAAAYASTDLFRKMMLRPSGGRFTGAVKALTPAIVMALLVICTAMIAYTGVSEHMIMRI
ncbi:MAG: hypothetical protein J6L99_00970 [Ruminococcus sp.]|nr:hypothetical protein [Ruminococcus sp.]